jgi:alkanesulfonate monooxygenase SsuD/methylene tetrahydromethanopterin reductase-like flavin-dependent oxidoreductase (luciferase family)
VQAATRVSAPGDWQGVSIHVAPDPCAGVREDVGEASVGERIGQPLSRGHHGKYYEFPDAHVTTPTVQQPGPPIWVASMGEQSVRRTARRGYHLAAGAGCGHALYEQQLREHGHDPATRLIASIPLRLHIAETRDKAWDECEAGLHQVLNFYRMRVNAQAGSIGSGVLRQLPPIGEFRNVPGIGHGGAPFVVGTSEIVAEVLSAYRDKRLTHLVLTFHAPGMTSEAVRRSMRAFARDIMPAIAAWQDIRRAARHPHHRFRPVSRWIAGCLAVGR